MTGMDDMDTRKSLQDFGLAPEGLAQALDLIRSLQPGLDQHIATSLAKGLSPWEIEGHLRLVLGAYCLRDSMVRGHRSDSAPRRGSLPKVWSRDS